MYYYLDGNVSLISQNLAVIDIGGAGYACKATANTLKNLEVNKKARLYTFCYIKEDAFDIYGFYELTEKRCFELLLSVSGVGPKAALSILSTATPESLALAIINNDETALTIAPGIGKKIAVRIIVELKDKVAKELAVPESAVFAPSHGGSDASGMESPGSKQNNAAAALAVLGYSQGEISAALRKVDITALSVEEIIKEVLAGHQSRN